MSRFRCSAASLENEPHSVSAVCVPFQTGGFLAVSVTAFTERSLPCANDHSPLEKRSNSAKLQVVFEPNWRNGRRGRLKICYPYGCPGSSPGFGISAVLRVLRKKPQPLARACKFKVYSPFFFSCRMPFAAPCGPIPPPTDKKFRCPTFLPIRRSYDMPTQLCE